MNDEQEARARWRQVRTLLETPILDEHKWSKVRSIHVEGVLADMEDSVAPIRKEEARARVVDALSDSTGAEGRRLIPRCNSLDTPWGYEDVVVLARAGVRCLLYPKLRSIEELLEVKRLLHENGSDPELLVGIETAGGVVELEAISKVDRVVALVFGPADLAVDVGSAIYVDGCIFDPAFSYARSKIALVGAASGLATFDIAFVTDLTDYEAVRRQVLTAKRLGFTGMSTFYPPHLAIIEEVFAPSEDELAHARWVVDQYEAALAQGNAAVKIGGRALVVQDYKLAVASLKSGKDSG